jgi:hypothetical protein
MSANRSRAFLLGSAVLWLLGAAFLFIALAARNGGLLHDKAVWTALFRLHDIAAVLAALAIAAAAWSLRNMAIRNGGISVAWLGTISGIATAVLLALPFLTGASDMLYMLPQGGIGLWLIALCARKPPGFGTTTRVVGLISGAGLVLIAISFVMIATALTAPWALADARSIPVTPADLASPLNHYGHRILYAGTLLGIPTYPIWAWLASRAPPGRSGLTIHSSRSRFAARLNSGVRRNDSLAA